MSLLTWDDYRSNRSEAKDEKDLYKVWRNHRCDVDALCSPIYAKIAMSSLHATRIFIRKLSARNSYY